MKAFILLVAAALFAPNACAQTGVPSNGDPARIESRITDALLLGEYPRLQKKLAGLPNFQQSDVQIFVEANQALNKAYRNPQLRNQAIKAYKLQNANRLAESRELLSQYRSTVSAINAAQYAKLAAQVSEQQWQSIARMLRPSGPETTQSDSDPLGLPMALAQELGLSSSEKDRLQIVVNQARADFNKQAKVLRQQAWREIVEPLSSQKGHELKAMIEVLLKQAK